MSREQDLEIAGILGFSWLGIEDAPHYTTDPAADYLVLEWCRNNMGENTLDVYDDMVCNDLMHHDLPITISYEPGTYSRALLATRKILDD